MLAKKKEKDVIDRMLDQIDFHRGKRFAQETDKPFLLQSFGCRNG